MGSSLDLVASFSHDSTRFAFQASVAQKNNVDIYPLNETKDYVVNSSLVSHIDYETNDMKVSDVIFFGWCSDLIDTQSLNTKRKLDEDDENRESSGQRYENFFVNGFPDGRIVVYSSNGKDIVNIIKSKKEILGADTDGSDIWILDSDKVVKKLQYNNSKPLKTFTLVDGKDDEIIHFQILHQNGTLLVCIVTEQMVYIVDPSKRRPSTKYSLEVSGAVTCEFSSDGKYLLIANLEELTAYDLNDDSKPIQSWPVQVKKLRTLDGLIMALTTDGKINNYKIGQADTVCSIVVNDNLGIIDFTPINNKQQVLISWLNVNEPNFESIFLEELDTEKLITINKSKKTSSDEANQKKLEEEKEKAEPEAQDEKTETEAKTNKKVSKSDQVEIANILSSHLEANSTEILDDLMSGSWTEPEIKKFILTKINTVDHLSKIFLTISKSITQNPWNEQDLLPLWLKWLLTLKSGELNSIKDKQTKKNCKHLKSALKSSEEILPVLLGIQGRLEMLRRQAKLREDLAQLTMQDREDDEIEVIEHSNVINNSLQDQASPVEKPEQDSIVYANGESDEFVDASEYKD
ncbi:Utp9p [Saccharomyces paradoxus]|uniref:Utp9p n=1 Tax=Saccharomyces paradoxus TaxID=27291 RepID=A0A8B8USZ5_SACPA|nr:Utp9 [Saccharomyces paradoxus]QHS73832.1 Utp9 [Saccharomyces paradoxus]